MFVVKGEDDGFAYHVTVIDAQALSHQVIKHPANGILVVDVLEHLTRVDISRQVFAWCIGVSRHAWLIGVKRGISLLIFPYDFELLFFLGRKVIILDAVVNDCRLLAELTIRHEVAVLDGLLVGVVGCGNTIFQVEQLVGGAVHVFTRRCGQSQQQSVEVVEDVAKLAED